MENKSKIREIKLFRFRLNWNINHAEVRERSRMAGDGWRGEDKDYKIEYYIAETAMENVTNDTNTFNFPSVRPPPRPLHPRTKTSGLLYWEMGKVWMIASSPPRPALSYFPPPLM